MGASITSSADPGLLAWLADHEVEYEVHEHAPAMTAMATAKAEGVDAHTFAKVVAVRLPDGRAAFLILETTDQLDLHKAARALGVDAVRLLTEGEMAAITPACEIGAVPAVGSLYGLPMVADRALRDDDAISFNAGSHRCSVRVERADWERATGVAYADLAAADGDRPAWSRS
jgi:Ala-tRNA(Pro) deacylase